MSRLLIFLGLYWGSPHLGKLPYGFSKVRCPCNRRCMGGYAMERGGAPLKGVMGVRGPLKEGETGVLHEDAGGLEISRGYRVSDN